MPKDKQFFVSNQRCRTWVIKVSGVGISNEIPLDSCKFPTEKIMGARNFNLPLHLSIIGASASNFAFLDKKSYKIKIFRQDEDFSTIFQQPKS